MLRESYDRLLGYIGLYDEARICRQVRTGDKAGYLRTLEGAVYRRRRTFGKALRTVEAGDHMRADALQRQIDTCDDLLNIIDPDFARRMQQAREDGRNAARRTMGAP